MNPFLKRILRLLGTALFILAATVEAGAEPWLAPGDTRLRHDLQLLSDTGVVNVPLSSWPLSWGDMDAALYGVDATNAPAAATDALQRIKSDLGTATDISEALLWLEAGIADKPRFIRTFENTPRNDASLLAGFSWMGERFAVNLNAALVDDSIDGDQLYPDGSYLGVALGNWMLSAGWQERWWGPGHDGSLILSTNARPSPGVSIQRNRSMPFESKWLRWIGPWSLTGFINQLDDDRVVSDALLFGLRVTFKPVDSLEIGLSRTAQLCGQGRPCEFKTFTDMLLGNDNRGVTVDPDSEPGNQLAGFDVRWALPNDIPLALYVQWIGEDGRNATALPGSWLRQGGIEFHGRIAGMDQRTHIEVSDTTCHEGGLGYADIKPNCAYEHSIYRTGYRYKQKSIAHGMDGDGLSYSLGSTLVQSAGHSWNLLLRYMEINRVGVQEPRHTISATSQELADIQLTHDRVTSFGRFYLGIGYNRLDDAATATTTNDVTAFVQWSTQ